MNRRGFITGTLAVGIATPVAALPIVFGKYAPGVVIDFETGYYEGRWVHSIVAIHHNGKTELRRIYG